MSNTQGFWPNFGTSTNTLKNRWKSIFCGYSSDIFSVCLVKGEGWGLRVKSEEWRTKNEGQRRIDSLNMRLGFSNDFVTSQMVDEIATLFEHPKKKVIASVAHTLILLFEGMEAHWARGAVFFKGVEDPPPKGWKMKGEGWRGGDESERWQSETWRVNNEVS